MKTCNGAALFPDTEMMSRTEGYKSNERVGELGLRWERKLLDHVDCFPSQPKWTYRLETSVLDVKIPVAAPVSQPLPLYYSASFHRHRSLAFHPPSVADHHPLLPLYLSFSLVRSFVRAFVLNVNDAMGRHGPANPKSPFPRYKALPLFSTSSFRWARLRANTFCEQTRRHKYRVTGEIDLLYFKDPMNTRKSNVPT